MTGFSEGGSLGKCECSIMRASISNKGKDDASSDTEMIEYRGQLNCKQCGAYAFKSQDKESQYCYVRSN